MRSFFFSCAIVFAIRGPVASGAVVVSLQNIPGAFSANDMTPDGRYIVGETDLNGDFVADGTYRFDRVTGTMLILPAQGIRATAVSDDGSVILGDIPDPNSPDPEMGETAAIWNEEAGWQSIGYLPNAGECPSRSNGYELSADGSVAVGLSWSGCFGRAFRWTQATGMQELQVLADDRNRASVCSGDGNLIGGFAQGTQTRTPTVWNNNLAGQLLDPPNGDARGEVLGINDAGTVMLGTFGTNSDPTNRAVQWTMSETGWQRQMLGQGSMGLPSVWAGIPMDIADNTGTIVGFDIYLGNRIAWILVNGAPPYVNLKTFIESHGGTVPAGQVLEVCQAISRNGRFICGHGSGKAWVVTINLLGDMNCDGFVDLNDVDPFVQVLLDPNGYEAGYPLCAASHADMNQDGTTNGLDLQLFTQCVSGTCP